MRPKVPRQHLRLLHTSDVHLTGHEGTARAFSAVVDLALERGVDAVLIAGDLFDHARVPAEAVETTLSELRRLRQPVVVIPGNHDCVDAGSIYERVDLGAAGSHVVFVGEPEGRQVLFEELGLAVWARGIEDHDPSHRPLAGYEAAPEGWWQVVLTHGHYVPRGEASYRSSQVHQDEIGALLCDYVALGHWHHFVDVSTDGVLACYSGSPTDAVGGPPTVNLVTLDPAAGPSVERVGVPGALP
ncbi:MAG TPA: DNA repair exonuclease [Acidimicrobiales bacterium]|nr:DNA repair exonuclease [Acidimicrobiales bacterium]